jgi:sarcosine oxidase, subunit gamma
VTVDRGAPRASVDARDPPSGRAPELSRIGESAAGVRARAVPFLAQVDLRVAPEHAGLVTLPLPREPNTAVESADRTSLWLGPDEWLIVGPPGSADGLVGQLQHELRGVHRSIVDVSAARVVIELGGERARELLSHGCSIDLHPRAWRAGMCAQTLIHGCPVLLHQRADATRIFVRPSFAEFLVDWILDVSAAPSEFAPAR